MSLRPNSGNRTTCHPAISCAALLSRVCTGAKLNTELRSARQIIASTVIAPPPELQFSNSLIMLPTMSLLAGSPPSAWVLPRDGGVPTLAIFG